MKYGIGAWGGSLGSSCRYHSIFAREPQWTEVSTEFLKNMQAGLGEEQHLHMCDIEGSILQQPRFYKTAFYPFPLIPTYSCPDLEKSE